MDFERRRRLVSEINLTALIDIVFHLMVFVMLTTSFVVSESMELSLPSDKAAPATAAAQPSIMRIQIISDGSVLVDNQAMSMEQLNNALVNRVAADPEEMALVRPSKLAATCCSRGSGSITVTVSPACASAMASALPTNPPPAMMTSLSIGRCYHTPVYLPTCTLFAHNAR